MRPEDTLSPEELAAMRDDDGDTLAPADEPQPLVYQADAPGDLHERSAALSEAEAELKRAFRSGEMEFDEFESQRDELLRQREAMTIARAKAEISQEMAWQGAQRQWQGAINRFMDATADEVDYRGDARMAADLDAFVRELGADPRHSSKPMGWFLQEAHRRVLALHLDAGTDDRERGAAGFDPDRVLALNGADFEDAIARMTPDQRERFARG